MRAVATGAVAVNVDEDADKLLAGASDIIGVDRVCAAGVVGVQVSVVRERGAGVERDRPGDHYSKQANAQGSAYERGALFMLRFRLLHLSPIPPPGVRPLVPCDSLVKKNGRD
jgi:hypothetical protein